MSTRITSSCCCVLPPCVLFIIALCDSVIRCLPYTVETRKVSFVQQGCLGKPQHKNIAVHLGIAQIAIGLPPPRTQTGTLWHLFSGKIMQMPVFTWTFLLKIGATNHPGKGLDPPTQTGNAQMNCYIFSLGLPLLTG